MPASHYEGKETTDYWEKGTGNGKGDLPTREHNASHERKKKAVERVRELTEQGWTCKEIAAEVGICDATVRRYQSPIGIT